ncbi:cysteine desulfurase family protein [Nonomuraea rosea]|uniref:cysteine desulfurase family protein n=1 Tax=Nonomuraea rosea TaxID=638574 RepID=UPI0031EEF6F5
MSRTHRRTGVLRRQCHPSVDPRVAEAMAPYLTMWFGNPWSGHRYAERPRQALTAARAQVAGLMGARAQELVFIASGSEANLLALRGAVLASERPHPHVVTQATEHPAVLETCRALRRLTVLPVDGDGLVDETVLVSVMAANNETGALQPISDLAALAHARGALFHCDAAQAAGKIPLDVRTWGVDLLTVWCIGTSSARTCASTARCDPPRTPRWPR